MGDVTQLYRHFDKEGNLLYVGISLSVFQRTREHRGNSSWFEKVAHIAVSTYATRKDAEIAERRAIEDEKPLYNLKHNDVKAPIFANTPYSTEKLSPIFANTAARPNNIFQTDTRQETSRELISQEDVASMLGITIGTLANWRSAGKGPKFVKASGRIRYRKSDVWNLIDSHVRQSTSERA